LTNIYKIVVKGCCDHSEFGTQYCSVWYVALDI